MPQAINPYAPIPSQEIDNVHKVDHDPSIGRVEFSTVVDEACWRQIRVAPPPPSALRLWALILLATSVAIVSGVILSEITLEPGNREAPFMILAIIIGMAGAIALVVYLDWFRVARSRQQIDVEPWFRGAIHGELTAEHLIVQSDTVSLAIPAQRIGKIQWYAGALQIQYGFISIPANPAYRLSIPVGAFADAERTVIPIVPNQKPMKEKIDQAQWQETVDRLIASLPSSETSFECTVPLADHLRWKDLEWLKERIYLRRFLRVVVALIVMVFVLFWVRAMMLPDTWQPRQESISSISKWSVVPVAAVIAYLAIYHLPWLAWRAITPIQGAILCDRTGDRKLICLRSGLSVAAYRGKPADYAKWTDHGLEVRPQPERLLFFVPARLIPEHDRPILAAAFPGVGEFAGDEPLDQHWEGPSVLPGGGIPVHQK